MNKNIMKGAAVAAAGLIVGMGGGFMLDQPAEVTKIVEVPVEKVTPGPVQIQEVEVVKFVDNGKMEELLQAIYDNDGDLDLYIDQEKFHAQFGLDFCVDLVESPEGRAKVQRAVNHFYPEAPKFFGASGSKNNAIFRKYGLKLRSNEDMRADYMMTRGYNTLRSINVNAPVNGAYLFVATEYNYPAATAMSYIHYDIAVNGAAAGQRRHDDAVRELEGAEAVRRKQQSHAGLPGDWTVCRQHRFWCSPGQWV